MALHTEYSKIKAFADREEAGKLLARSLEQYKNDPNAIVLALPRGGVVVGFEIARFLRIPLDILVVRKIGAPSNPEFAIGSIDDEGKTILNDSVIDYYNISKTYINETIEKETKEAQRRQRHYRGKRSPIDLKGKTVILVDDGIATGFSMRAAINSVKDRGAKKMIVAVPVAASDIVNKINEEVNEVICLIIPDIFIAVGSFYNYFPQTTDEEVIDLLYRRNL